MILELEYPYKPLYKKAYIRKQKDSGRWVVDLYNNEKDRTTITYAKYVWCVCNNQLVPDGYEVDHIDGDKENDKISNLQILTKDDHKIKSSKERRVEDPVYLCKYCEEPFTRRKGQSSVFCSRSCNCIYHYKYNKSSLHTTREISVNKSQHERIVQLRKKGLSDYKISEILPFTKSKIQRYRKLNNIE